MADSPRLRSSQRRQGITPWHADVFDPRPSSRCWHFEFVNTSGRIPGVVFVRAAHQQVDLFSRLAPAGICFSMCSNGLFNSSSSPVLPQSSGVEAALPAGMRDMDAVAHPTRCTDSS